MAHPAGRLVFPRSETVALTATDGNFRVRISHTTGDPHWTAALVDYDGSVGATGRFESEREAVANMDGFLRLAYEA